MPALCEICKALSVSCGHRKQDTITAILKSEEICRLRSTNASPQSRVEMYYDVPGFADWLARNNRLVVSKKAHDDINATPLISRLMFSLNEFARLMALLT